MSSLYGTRFRSQTFEGPPVQYHDRLYSSASIDPILPGFILLRRANGDIEIVSVKNREEIRVLMDSQVSASSQALDLEDVPME
jgi:hypothetical protein